MVPGAQIYKLDAPEWFGIQFYGTYTTGLSKLFFGLDESSRESPFFFDL